MTLYKIVSERLDFVSFLSLIRDIRKHLRVICGGADSRRAKDYAIRPVFFTAKFYLKGKLIDLRCQVNVAFFYVIFHVNIAFLTYYCIL